MFEINPIGDTLDDQLNSMLNQIAQFIANGNYTTEDFGIGHYEYGGVTGYDKNVATIYDDEEYFKININKSVIPHDYVSVADFWGDMEAFGVTTVEDEELILNPEFIDGECFFVVKRT